MSSSFWLSCHVDYACRHSGVCCRAGWPLPVEDGVVDDIARAVERGRLATVDGQRIWFLERADAPEGVAGTLRQLTTGACVFHRVRDSAGSGQATHDCAVHAALGHEALPSTCQHFPRVCLVDDRGVRVSLSHVCPTAAAMLVDDVRPVTIVAGPAAVPGREVPEGLDARGQLPPRLSARVLADWDGFTAWEAHIVNVLAGSDAVDATAERALARLAGDAEVLASWTPHAGALVDAVARRSTLGWVDAADSVDVGAAAVRREASAAVVRATCRAPWTWPDPPADVRALDARWVAPVWTSHAAVVRRYLAARAFGAWASYRIDAARGLVTWLCVVLDVLRMECAVQCAAASRALDREQLTAAIRQADLLLLHYADEGAVAEVLSAPGFGSRVSGPGALSRNQRLGARA